MTSSFVPSEKMIRAWTLADAILEQFAQTPTDPVLTKVLMQMYVFVLVGCQLVFGIPQAEYARLTQILAGVLVP